MKLIALVLSTVALAGCRVGENLAVKSTSKVLLAAQPSLQMEADYDMARMAIPGALKTVEGFWVTGLGNDESKARLERILTEGYCQYGTGFVEDDWEEAKFRQDPPAVAYHNARSSNVFTRCLNFALIGLGKRWQKELFEGPDIVTKLLSDTGKGKRFQLLFAANALGSLINHNLSRIEMISHLGTVQAMLEKVVEMDKSGLPANLTHAALPHVALGMIHSGKGKAMGGNPDLAKKHFEEALRITNDKFLLARTLMAYRIGLQTNDRKFFHDQLVKVLETPPSVWPEQRLANEVAHRRARRYLSHEKDLFQ
jgi:hypothetical protein